MPAYMIVTVTATGRARSDANLCVLRDALLKTLREARVTTSVDQVKVEGKLG